MVVSQALGALGRSKVYLDFLQLPQRRGDGLSGGADGGKESADEADERGPDDSLDDELGRDLEGEGDLAEALPVDGGGVESVEGDIGYGRADDAADERDGERFEHDGHDDCSAAKPERAQGGNFARPRRYGVIHGVERAED